MSFDFGHEDGCAQAVADVSEKPSDAAAWYEAPLSAARSAVEATRREDVGVLRVRQAALARLLVEAAYGESEVEQSDAGESAALLAEARAVLHEAFADASGGGDLRRSLTATLAYLNLADYLSGADPGGADTAIALLESVLESEAEAVAAQPPWISANRSPAQAELWNDELADDARADLVDLLAECCGQQGGPDSIRDRLIHHLELLVASPVQLSADAAAARRVGLGLALADRSRGPRFRSPAQTADRERAIAILRAQLAGGNLDADLDAEARVNLAQLLLAQDDARHGDTGHQLPGELVDELFALLGPVLSDEECPQRPYAFSLAVVIESEVCAHEPTAEHRQALVERCRAALAGYGIDPEDADEYRRLLAQQLLDRADGLWPEAAPGADTANASARPEPAQDEAEALALVVEIARSTSDAVGPDVPSDDPRAELHVMALATIVDVLGRTSPNAMDDETLDSYIEYCDRLVATIAAQDPARGEACGRLGGGLFERGRRGAEPNLNRFMHEVFGAMLDPSKRPDEFEQIAPEAHADFERAAEVLRAAIDLCAPGSAEYFLAVVALAFTLLMTYCTRYQLADRALIRESLHWIRVAFDTAPEAAADAFAEAKRLFALALIYDLWLTGPFTSVRFGASGVIEIPDPASVPSVAEDVHVIEELIRADRELSAQRGTPPEPMLAFLFTLLAYMQGPSRRAEYLEGLHAIVEGEQGFDEYTRWVPFMARYLLKAEDSPLQTPPSELTGYLQQAFRLMGGAVGHDDLTGMLDRMSATGAMRASLEQIFAPTPATGIEWSVPAAEVAAEPSGPAPRAARHKAVISADPDAVLEVDPQAAMPIGDASPYPFTQPTGRVFEVLEEARTAGLEEAGARGPVPPVIRALALHQRWLRERDPGDFAAAIESALRSAATMETGSALALRVVAFVTGLLMDRYSLLGDRADLEAARRGYADLLARAARSPDIPDLTELLAAHCASTGDAALGALLSRAAPDAPDAEDLGGRSGSFRAEMAAAFGEAHLLSARAPEEYARALALLGEAESELPERHPKRFSVVCELAGAEAELAASAGDRRALDAAVQRMLGAATDCPADNPRRPALLLRAAAVLAGHATAAGLGSAEQAARALDRGIALLEEAAATNAHAYLGARVRCRYGLGRLLHLRALRNGDPADLDRAITALGDAWTGTNPAPGDPFGILVRRALAEAHRAYGPEDAANRRRSREAASAVLAQQREAVLLQTGTRHGLDAAWRAEQDMACLVRWCLEDGEWAEAVQALERGRGLVLNAVTVSADVPSRLRAAGRADLADRWVQAGPAPAGPGGRGAGGLTAIPDDLRRHALEILEGTADERHLLAVPSLADVGAALHKSGVDAFVYLVAGEETHAGHALIVRATAGGSPGCVLDELELPLLRIEPGGVLDRYACALARRQPETFTARSLPLPEIRERGEGEAGLRDAYGTGSVTLTTPEEGWERALEELCRWAGDVAAARLLGFLRESVPNRAPRIVIASAGLLGLVPWHAATLTVPGRGERRMCQEAVVSHCVTARQFSDAAARPVPAPDAATAMIVDPHGSAQMHLEAATIRSAFYPHCTVVGALSRLDADAGPVQSWPRPSTSVESLLPLLPGQGASSAALLIANCHAAAGATAADSLLVLDSGEPRRIVTVEQLLSGAHRRDPAAPGGLIVLVDCGSDLTLAQHDESMTLTTALLAAGAGAVVGARWPVDDNDGTTALMFMFHHFLNGGGEPHRPEAVGSPAQALSAAQCWMLDPDRRYPSTPEGEALARRVAGRSLADTRAWAAFTHHGR